MKNLVLKTKSRLAIGGALLASLCVTPLAANAQLPPTANGFTVPIPIDSAANWTTILIRSVPPSAATRYCQVVGSLNAVNPGGNAAIQNYLFTVSLDDANPLTNGPAERRIELRDQPGVNDPDTWPVSTNDVFILSPNVAHTIRLLGRRFPTAPNLTVRGSTLSVVCQPI